MSYTFYRGTEVYHTDNLAGFCREHSLQRRHMQEVVLGKRGQHHGFSQGVPPDLRSCSLDRERLTPVEDVLVMAEIAARSVGGDYEKLVMGRVAQIRSGNPLLVNQAEDLSE
jgi:hypothetical protein